MIIEGLLTTMAENGEPHVAPMGPMVDEDLVNWCLRPFQTSTTFHRLRANPICIFHVVDDVVPLVQTALGLPHQLEFKEHSQGGFIITSACHWYRLQVTDWNLDSDRTQAAAQVLERGRLREFWGWNRAKHAILEATILATRLHLLQPSQVDLELAQHAVIVDKTAGPRERQAWQMLVDYFASHHRR